MYGNQVFFFITINEECEYAFTKALLESTGIVIYQLRFRIECTVKCNNVSALAENLNVSPLALEAFLA